jgi:hypothetical protein
MKENKAPTLFRGLRFVGFAALLAFGVVLVEAAFQAAPAKHVTKQAESLETTEEFVVAGWEVETAGAMKNIEDIRPGDVVMAMDDETGEMLPKRVVQVFKNFADHVYVVTIRSSDEISEQVIRATGVHPFFVPGRGWIEAQQLRSGDSLVQSDEQVATVVAVKREDFEQPIAVYNFEVEDFHTYFVSASNFNAPVLAHNAPCTPGVGSTRHIKGLTKANNGTYKITFESGKTYVGKGGTSRARRSARQRSRDNSDPVKSIEHQAADNDFDAFKTEHDWLEATGGAGNAEKNYNQINSPGKTGKG